MHTIYITLLAICFSSCKQYKPEVIFYKTQDFTVADSAGKADRFLPFGTQHSDYPIYYIGAKADTIKIGKRYWRGRTPWTSNLPGARSKEYSGKTLRIIASTAVTTNSPVESFAGSPDPGNDPAINYSSFILTIENISGSTICLGRTFSLYFMHREVRNKKGKWIKLDKKLSEAGICLTGEPVLLLKPGEIAVSKIRRYSGSLLADFRLAFGYDNKIVYSNTFRDYIDDQTFQNISQQD